MIRGTNRNEDRAAGTTIEYEFKDLIEKDNFFEVFLTQIEWTNSGKTGPYLNGGFIGGDADVFIRETSEKLCHCEIKGKDRDSYQQYGLELYRLRNYLAIENMMMKMRHHSTIRNIVKRRSNTN